MVEGEIVDRAGIAYHGASAPALAYSSVHHGIKAQKCPAPPPNDAGLFLRLIAD